MKIKLTLLYTLFLLISGVCYADNAPKWVTKKPVSNSKYIGISRVSLEDKECREKATKLALSDIAAQISVLVESESFMRVVDLDGHAKELFEKSINQTIETHIEGQELVDTYESDTHYYVYYELDKALFRKNMEAKRARAINDGLDMYVKGVEAEELSNLTNAAQFYIKGLELIEPYLYMSLTTQLNGEKIDVANELYSAFKNVFTGMTITTNVAQLEAEVFKPVAEPIAACLSRNGAVIPNVTLKAEFVSGNGSVTPPTKTDYSGTSVFYIKNVASKESIQTISISIDESILNSLPKSYREIININDWPAAKITLAIVNPNYTAYFDVENNDIESCESYVRRLLANNYFELTEDTSADLYISYSTTFEAGGLVAGEIYDFNECFCTLVLKIYDNNTQGLLLEYSLPSIRVLVPTNKSVPQTMQMCSRELYKRFNVQLPIQLKKMNLNN